jgi:uncharacterized membrane protein YfcA
VTAAGFLLVFLAALIGGAVNSIAGGGTLITFPAIVWLGVPPISANATSTVALWPGSFGSMWAYRDELRGARTWLTWFTVPSIAGSVVGAQLLLHTAPDRFDAIVPFLVLGATLLFLLQRPLSRRLVRRTPEEQDGRPVLPRPSWWLIAGQFAVAVYGGYFGAGIGILMLSALSILGLKDIHEMNSLKVVFGGAINGIAALYFVWAHMVYWPDVLVMVAGALLGGWGGAGTARKLGRRTVRGIVVGVGLTIALWLFVKP